ncbi:MAG: CHASE2 domain-containing protein [Bacteroidetes bacterium]|nr:CHASE2 domain-containing protein [Bacteroidota bacterium]
MSRTARTLHRFLKRRRLELLVAAFLAPLLSVVASNLPQMNLVQSAINDDNFTDFVLQTRGELAIDTNIRVLTYDSSILDSNDLVNRATLAMNLAALFELKPRVVGVDFLLETERPDAPDGDAMLSALIGDHPDNLVFGIFYEDSLNSFRVPPKSFRLNDRQIGCINLITDDDNTIRTFTPTWGADTGRRCEAFDLKLARATDSTAAEYLTSFGDQNFVIDYAGGIGETIHNGSEGDQIFPVMPLKTVFDIVSSGDSAKTAALREQYRGKTVLVGYGDIRNGQVTNVVDRFYTPLKPEKNTLPDMHGVAIHANILNDILRRRVMEKMPMATNILWSAVLVLILLAGRERLKRVKHPTRKAVLTYTGFAVLFALAALLPVEAFRYTPYKFSIFTPIASLLLAVPTLEGLGKGIDLLLDLRRRVYLRHALAPAMRAGMLGILKAWSIEERIERASHFLERQFHAAGAILFAEAAAGNFPRFPATAVGSPTLARLVDAIDRATAAEAPLSPRAAQAVAILRTLAAEPVLAATLRLSRSLYIALNEIRRQSEEMDEPEANADAGLHDEAQARTTDYADLALKTLAGQKGADDEEHFDELYAALERFVAAAAAILTTNDGAVADLLPPGETLPPYVFTSRCSLHRVEEQFIYFGEQEDANNRDDFFDLLYGGNTIRCQPGEHPGLTRFRELSAAARRPGEGDA